jgi:LmbE family N-acetylglucosaminyl deacetylase
MEEGEYRYKYRIKGKNMLDAEFRKKKNEGIKILCLGAHCDDIEIGCGGTLLRLLEKHKNSEVHWVVFSSDPRREREARSSAEIFLRHGGNKMIQIENFRNGFFPYVGGQIKEYFETLKEEFSPDVIFTHYRMDLHQDHRTVSELTWNTFRDHLILEYEIPKYDGDFGVPNLYVPLEYTVCLDKIKIILKLFKSQRDKHWLTKDLLLSVLRIRGMECVSHSGYAEGFYCRKVIFGC